MGKLLTGRRLTGELTYPLLAVMAAFLIGGVVVLLIGENPLTVYWLLLTSAFGLYDALGNFTWDNWGYTLFYATPLIFTGLAVALAFQCGLLNIGAEGQLYVAAFAAAWVGFTLTGLPGVVLTVLAILAAMLAGGLWGALPGWLKARFGAHEVINTIMLNFVAIGLVSYLTQNYFKVPSDPIMQTGLIAEKAALPRLAVLLAPLGIDFPGRIPLNLTFILALLAAFLVRFFPVSYTQLPLPINKIVEDHRER